MIVATETAADFLPVWMLLSAAFGFIIGDAIGDSSRHRKCLEQANADLREQLDGARDGHSLGKEPRSRQDMVAFDLKAAGINLDELEARMARLEQSISRHHELPAPMLKHLTAVIHDTHKHVVSISKSLHNRSSTASPKIEGSD